MKKDHHIKELGKELRHQLIQTTIRLLQFGELVEKRKENKNMKKLSNRTINVIKKYLLLKLGNNEISLNNFDEMLKILSSMISGLVIDIEDNNNDTQENRDLLNELDYAFDEMNEANEIDFNDLNKHLK